MEVLKHVAKEHSKNIIASISVKEKEKLSAEDNGDISDNENNIDKLFQFKCFKCKNAVSLDNSDDLEEDQVCKFCIMTSAYGD